MTDYMLVSDAGDKGQIVTVMDKVNYAFDLIHHFDLLIFSKENYEFYRTPRKLNSYILQLTTGATIPLGITVVTAIEKADFNWLLLDSSYNTIGVPGIAMPIGALDAKILSNY